MKTTNYAVLARNLFLQHELAGLLQSCRDADIPVILLKGSALLALGLLAGDERMMADVDVLVERNDLAAFRKIIERSGFRRIGTSARDYLKDDADALKQMALDIHTELWHARDREELWNDARPAAIEGVAVSTLSLEGMVLHFIAHAVLHSACLDQRAISDICRLARADGFQWEKLLHKTNRLGMGVLVGPVLRELRTEVDVPQAIVDRVTVPLAQRPWQAFFLQAARRREAAHLMQYVLPALFRPRLAWAAAFPGAEIIVERFGCDSCLNRAKRPFQLLVNALGRG
jgi:hypothetical protein